MIKSWADDERTLFMDKFLQHPKDFRKISTYLQGRSPGDCVAFFYKNQKLDDFSTVRRKQQLKKRRLQVRLGPGEGTGQVVVLLSCETC